MAMTQADLIIKITNVLGISVKKHEVLSYDGYGTIYTIIHWNYEKIREWCTTKSTLTTNRGGASYGDRKIKCLQALAWWSTDLNLRGKHIVLADFDATRMAYCIDEAKLDYEDGKKAPKTKKPDKFSHRNCLAWEDMVYT